MRTIMSTIFDKPAVDMFVVVLGSIVLFVPTGIAHFRRIRAFRWVSALNALTLLPVFCFLVPGYLFWGLPSPQFIWGTVAIWLAATIWSLAGRQRDS
jgi:hypothetical protein